jgi:hypothetical protein
LYEVAQTYLNPRIKNTANIYFSIV